MLANDLLKVGLYMSLHENSEVFRDLVLVTAEKYNLSDDVIIKDYFVYIFLKNLAEIDPNVIFKGGTSLSKCYKIIDRFSEDVDLTFSIDGKVITTSQRQKVASNIEAVCEKLGFEIVNAKDIKSRMQYKRYLITTAQLNDPKIVRNTIIVETMTTFLSYPVEVKSVSSFLRDYLVDTDNDSLIEAYELETFNIKTQSIERTFVDKVFAICDYYMTGKIHEKSRHIYDLAMLIKHVKLDNEMKELINRVRITRQKQTKRCPSSEASVLINDLLKDIVKNHIYKDDYDEITTKLLFKPFDYIDAIKALEVIINADIF